MTETDKHKIAISFPDKFIQADLEIRISVTDFEVFEKGIFSDNMDEKWNIFVLNNVLYLARSWTNFCIYKVYLNYLENEVLLTKFQVNRNNEQYKSLDLERDTIVLKSILKRFY